MASEQQQRRVRDENVSEERNVHVEKDIVPNLASHFESLAEKVRDSEVVSAKEVPTGEDKSKVSITLADKSSTGGGHHQQMGSQKKVEAGETQKSRESEIMKGGARSVGKFEGNRAETESKSKTPTLEEISKVRQQAQQNSIDTLRTAEQRNQEQRKTEQGKRGTESAPAYEGAMMEKGREGEKFAGAGQTAGEHTKGTVGEAVSRSTQAVPEYGRAAMEKSQQGMEYAKEKLAAAGQTATEYSKLTADQARKMAARGAEGTVETAKNVKDYAAEKAVAAKDVTMEGGKDAASVVGRVTGEVVDRAAMVGWGAAHLTAEVAVEGTKMAAKAVTGVAGYAKDTAVAVGSKASQIAANQAEKVKDVAARTGETAKEYTARKQEEAKKDLQCKQASGTETAQVGREGKTGGGFGEKLEGGWEGTKDKVSSGVGKAKGTSEGMTQQGVQEGRGVLGAIGETIMEIAQQTTELVTPAAVDEDDSFIIEEARGERRASK